MSDTPKKKRPARRMTDEEFELFYADIYKEFGPQAEAAKTNLVQDVPVRKTPNPAQKMPGSVEHPAQAPAPVKKSNNRGLIVLICLELLGIAGVAAWWVLRLL